MTNMFKKSLVALAIASASTGAMAADLATGTVTRNVSTEYLEVAPAGTLTSNAVVLELGAEYAVNDVITLTFTGGDALDVDSLPPFVTVAAAAPEKGITVGLISTSVENGTTKANYRVTDVTGGATDTTTGITLDFGTLDFDSTKAANGINVAFSAVTNTGLNLDTAGGALRNEDLFAIDDQFEITIDTALDEVIDVEDERETFVGALTADQLVFTAAETAAFDLSADVDGVDYSVAGNFSWVKDTDANTAGIQATVGTFAVTATGAAVCTAPVVTATALTFSCDVLDQITVDIDTGPQGSDVVLPAGTFGVDTNVQYSFVGGTDSDKDLDRAAAGAWTLNGSETFIPYMPYSRDDLSNISQIIYVTNSGTQSGEISVDVISADGTTTNLSNADLGGILAAPGVTKLTGPIVDALTDAGLLTGGSSTKQFALNIVVNDANDVISVYSAYNVNGSDRGWVQNDSVVVNRAKN
ncbi:hypothetical protein [Pseudidiomarina aestuarii]|uniref:hypothetical protein n=1 Tax=Pseudidiomarina aestuarii TaxID=624146 RepID=UPI003A97FD21